MYQSLAMEIEAILIELVSLRIVSSALTKLLFFRPGQANTKLLRHSPRNFFLHRLLVCHLAVVLIAP